MHSRERVQSVSCPQMSGFSRGGVVLKLERLFHLLGGSLKLSSPIGLGYLSLCFQLFQLEKLGRMGKLSCMFH